MGKEKILWGSAIVAFVIGSIGFLDRLIYGEIHHNTGSYVSWGLLVSGYVYFIGLSAGAFLLSSLVYVFGVTKLEKIGKFSLFTALICLIMAMLSIFLDMGHPIRALKNFIVSPNFHSIMGWMIFLYLAYFTLLFVELLVACKENFSFAGMTGAKILTVLGTLGIPLAIAFHGGVGAIFGVVIAKPFWYSSLFPIMFITEALLSGGALATSLFYLLAPDKGTRAYQDIVVFLGKIVLGLLVFYILLLLSDMLVVFYGNIPQHVDSYKFLMWGPYAYYYWVGQVFLAILLPLTLLTFKGKSASFVNLSALSIVIGFIAVRLNIVVPGGVVPPFEGFRTAIIDPWLSFEYFPSIMEWLYELWVLSIGMFLFLFGLRILPLFQHKSFSEKV